ncbi:MAG TPA: hypothetical protein VH025_00775 [Solirubrobacteraceae bacterium]|jgi:hypothetical protein|nr:hypothetical protein [Solirubrobacteraceae bacterium]
MTRSLALTLITVLLAGAAVGCGTKTVETTNANGETTTRTVPNVHFAKTKFLVHMGLAFGAFHRYIDKPYKAGSFKKGAQGRVKALAKAGAAALLAVHELRTARDDALSDDHLRPLAEKIERLLGTLTHLGSAFKGGSFSPGAIVGAAGAVTALGSASGGLGATIKEVVPAL